MRTMKLQVIGTDTFPFPTPRQDREENVSERTSPSYVRTATGDKSSEEDTHTDADGVCGVILAEKLTIIEYIRRDARRALNVQSGTQSKAVAT